MVSNYKILRKAKLLDDLFVSDLDEAAVVQEEADRDWARDQDKDVLGEVVAPSPASAVALAESPAAIFEGEEASVLVMPSPTAAAVDTKPPVYVAAGRNWTEILADLTGNPNIAGIRCLGVCGLERKTGAGDAVAVLAHWAVQHTDRPALLVEAHFRAPRLGEKFGARERGVSDALLRGLGVDEAIQPSGHAKLELLTGGSPLGLFRRGRALSRFPALFTALRDRYDTIIVELPAVDDPSFSKLPIASLADAVMLVADPKTAQPSKLRRAADRLREARVPLAAAMLSSVQVLTESLGRGPAPRAETNVLKRRR